MRSEALRNIRTMGQVKTSLDTAGSRRTKTTNHLSRTRQEIEELSAIGNPRTAQVLARERARSAAYDASVERSRQRVLKSRDRLAATINRNRSLTELRHSLQRARWDKPAPPPTASTEAHDRLRLRETELRY